MNRMNKDSERVLPTWEAAFVGCALAVGRAASSAPIVFLAMIAATLGAGAHTATRATIVAGPAGLVVGGVIAFVRRGRMVRGRTIAVVTAIAVAGGVISTVAPSLPCRRVVVDRLEAPVQADRRPPPARRQRRSVRRVRRILVSAHPAGRAPRLAGVGVAVGGRAGVVRFLAAPLIRVFAARADTDAPATARAAFTVSLVAPVVLALAAPLTPMPPIAIAMVALGLLIAEITLPGGLVAVRAQVDLSADQAEVSVAVMVAGTVGVTVAGLATAPLSWLGSCLAGAALSTIALLAGSATLERKAT